MGLLKSGWMQPVVEESTAADSEAETETQAETQAEPGAKALISDIPDDAFGHVLFWLPPLTNLAAARVAKQWRVRVAIYSASPSASVKCGTAPSVLVRTRDNLREYCGSLCTTSMISCLTRWRVGRYRLSSSSREISAKTRDGPCALGQLKTSRPTSTTKDS